MAKPMPALLPVINALCLSAHPARQADRERLCRELNGRLREECLNISWFRNLFDARRQIEFWRSHYNTDRPRSSLGYRTPEEFAALSRAAGRCSAEVHLSDGFNQLGVFTS